MFLFFSPCQDLYIHVQHVYIICHSWNPVALGPLLCLLYIIMCILCHHFNKKLVSPLVVQSAGVQCDRDTREVQHDWYNRPFTLTVKYARNVN